MTSFQSLLILTQQSPSENTPKDLQYIKQCGLHQSDLSYLYSPASHRGIIIHSISMVGVTIFFCSSREKPRRRADQVHKPTFPLNLSHPSLASHNSTSLHAIPWFYACTQPGDIKFNVRITDLLISHPFPVLLFVYLCRW